MCNKLLIVVLYLAYVPEAINYYLARGIIDLGGKVLVPMVGLSLDWAIHIGVDLLK